MLIEDIQSFNVVMPQLMQYIKSRNYNINEFFIKFELPLQYMVIQEFLFIHYDLMLMITPQVIGIKHWIDPNDAYEHIVYAEKVIDTKTKLNHCYTKLIVEAFKYIEKRPF